MTEALTRSIEHWYRLWITPSLLISLLVESERGSSLLSYASQIALLSRYLLGRPSILRQALQYELKSRPVGDVISALTLRYVDHAYFGMQNTISLTQYNAVPSGTLASEIAVMEEIDDDDPAYTLLENSLERVLTTYKVVEKVFDRSQTTYIDNDTNQGLLRELWSLLKPDVTLSSMVTKQWQDIGFQGASPPTDFRGLGMLALDSLLFFAREYGEKAQVTVHEAVEGGEHWYPLALASIHMTSFALDLAMTRDLQMYLLRSLQYSPSPVDPVNESTLLTSSATAESAIGNGSRSRTDPELGITAFLRISSELLLLFHAEWRRREYTVMRNSTQTEFEQVSQSFQTAVRPWIRRGVLDGRCLGWGDHRDLTHIKQD